jgi:hypothetical protein
MTLQPPRVCGGEATPDAEGATDEHTDLFPGATDPFVQLALSGAARLLLEDL